MNTYFVGIIKSTTLHDIFITLPNVKDIGKYHDRNIVAIIAKVTFIIVPWWKAREKSSFVLYSSLKNIFSKKTTKIYHLNNSLDVGEKVLQEMEIIILDSV